MQVQSRLRSLAPTMKIGVDASNLTTGGGVTHLVELLRAAEPRAHGFESIIVWAGKSTLGRLEDRPWLNKVHVPTLDRALPFRIFWQCFRLAKLARREECNVLLVPGGSYLGEFRPFVTMSRNMLPFEWTEMGRYGWSWQWLRHAILRRTQARTFRRADGLIFLSQYAQTAVTEIVGPICGSATVIPHGIHDGFVQEPRLQHDIREYSQERPFRILYVSKVDVNKHQWHVVDAIGRLRRSGIPVHLDLVGPPCGEAFKRLERALTQTLNCDNFIHYHGDVSYSDLPRWYCGADAFVFASSCENMPNILLEAMACGMPIACSKMGPMPEVLRDGGIYFDPLEPDDIATAIKMLIESPRLRADKAAMAYRRSKAFSWRRCDDETFRFIQQVATSA